MNLLRLRFEGLGILLQLFLLEKVTDHQPEKSQRGKSPLEKAAQRICVERCELTPSNLIRDIERPKQQPSNSQRETQPDPPIHEKLLPPNTALDYLSSGSSGKSV